MDFSSKISFESKHLNVCRCCLREDGSTDISSYNIDSNEKETYGDMLKRTFNIQLSSHHSDEGLICEHCAKSLQDASTFRLMVLQSQKTLEYLRLHCHDGDIKYPSQDVMGPIKMEEDECFNNDDGNSADDNEILANLKTNYSKTGDKAKRKCRIVRKHKRKKFKIKEDSELASKEPALKDWDKISERRGTGPLLRDNSLKLIQYSNLCVFQWNKSQYRCFCCNTPFTDIQMLKQHTFKEHSLENIEKKIISQQNRLVKVEISNLECKLCHERLDSVSNLKQHLSKTHSIAIYEDLLVPFRIEEVLKCQICFEKFSMFRLLNIHINRHFQKQVCHICGAGFSNLVFLNLHKTRSHRSFDCKPCNLIFNSKSDKKHHDVTIHGVKYERKLRFPCTFCPERFPQENFKIKHMVEKHGLNKPDFRCGVCQKSFLTRSLLNNHVKNVHNKEKNQECDVCHNLFYTKSDVARHKVTHTGEKRFSCEMCCNPFASRDSLRRHMKRTHVGVN